MRGDVFRSGHSEPPWSRRQPAVMVLSIEGRGGEAGVILDCSFYLKDIRSTCCSGSTKTSWLMGLLSREALYFLL